MVYTSSDEPIFSRPLVKTAVTPPPSLAPRRIPLHGRFARLEALDPAQHGPELYRAGHELEGSTEVWAYLPYGPWASFDAFQGHLRAQAAALDTVFYAICSVETGKPVGVASFLEIDPENGCIEIGHIWLSPEIQRHVIGSEALILMMIHAMEDLGNRRLQWKSDALNQRSRAAARRYGFRFEGVLMQHRITKGQNRDTAYYSILDHEWPELAKALKYWLSPEVIDSEGIANQSLSTLTAQ